MARIIGGSMIGELSGKLGGNVFARNKAGAYIRQYVIPVNPNTVAQINARNSFAYASSSYHALEPAEKAVWQSFAQNYYLPKNNANTGQFSGFNAFTALQNVVSNANRLRAALPEYEFSAGPVLLPAFNEFETNLVAPNQQIQANLTYGTGQITPLYLSDSSSINSSGTATIILNLGSDTITPSPISLTLPFQDGAGNLIGFTAYMSNPVQQEGMFIANPEKYNLGFVPNLAAGTPTPAATSTIQFTLSVVDPSDYQAFPQVNDWVMLTVYSVSTNGQMIRIGSKMSLIV